MDKVNILKSDKINEVEKVIIAENAFKTLETIIKFFNDKPEATISKEDFEALQREVWNETKDRFNVVVEDDVVKITGVFNS